METNLNTIALTGATSMLGVALISECIKNNVRVIAFIRPDSKRICRLPKSDLITVVDCDLDSLKDISLESLSADIFYHIGWAYTDKDRRNFPVLQNLNIKYTLDAVSVAQKLGCQKFIGTGSQAEYGCYNSIISPTTPVCPETAYGIAKFAAGKLSSIECNKKGIEHIWVRVFSVYGTNDNEGTLLKTFIMKAKANEPMPLTKCEQVWDFLHEDDAGRALYLVAKRGLPGRIYCLGSGIGKPLHFFIETVRDIVNPKYQPQFGELPYAPNQIMNLCADISSIEVDTNWKPTIEFSDGVKRMINS